MKLAKIYNDVATIYGQDVDNEANVYLARRLLNKALNLVRESKETNVKLEASIYQNMSAVNNRLEKYNESLKCCKLAYALMDSCKKILILKDSRLKK